MNDVINRRLAVLETYYAEIAREEQTAREVLDTYNGMLSFSNDGDGSDTILAGITKWEAELAQLAADRAEIDHMWNEAVA